LQRNLSRRGIATIRQVLDCRTIYIPGASIIVTHVRLFLSRSGQTTRLAYVVARTWTNVTSVIPLSVHRNIYLYSICVSVKRVAVSKFLLSHIPPFSINLQKNLHVRKFNTGLTAKIYVVKFSNRLLGSQNIFFL